MTSSLQLKRCLAGCRQCDKRILCAVLVVVLFNLNSFVLFLYYFKDAPDFPGSSTVEYTQHLRKSPYIHLNGSMSSVSADERATRDQVNSDVLPAFSSDSTEFILSAIIERQEETMMKLYLTVFALNRMLLYRGRSNWGTNRVRKEAKVAWQTMEKKAKRIYYHPNGTRDKFSNIFCQISNLDGTNPYITKGRFIPNALSADNSFNGVVDIFRCDIYESTNSTFGQLSASKHSLQVQLMRQKRNSRFDSLLNFSVPWRTRRTGFMHHYGNNFEYSPSSSKIDGDVHTNRRHIEEQLHIRNEHLAFSKWDPWGRANDESHSPIYLCISGRTGSPTVDDVAILLEFVQHHLLIGVRHIFLSVRFAWDSKNMRTLLLALRHFIEQKKVTVSSQASDGYDRTASTKGMAWGDDFLQLFHCTITLYMTKGIHGAEHRPYLGVWGVGDFFIPPTPHLSISPLLHHAIDGIDRNDCFVLLQRLNFRPKHHIKHGDLIVPWTGVKFASNFHFVNRGNETRLDDFNYLLPVEKVFQLGIPLDAVCRTIRKTNGAVFLSELQNLDFDYKESRRMFSGFDNTIKAATLNSTSSAFLYNFADVQSSVRSTYNSSEVLHNRYVTDFFPEVLTHLKKYNLDLIISLNLPKDAARVGTAVEHWPQYKTIDEESVLVY